MSANGDETQVIVQLVDIQLLKYIKSANLTPPHLPLEGGGHSFWLLFPETKHRSRRIVQIDDCGVLRPAFRR